MSIPDVFREWAVARGVKLNGIAAHRFPGKGFGIIAETKLNAGDALLNVPVSALCTVQTIPKNICRLIGTISVHGLLAAELSMDSSEDRASWRAIFPTRDDLAKSIPLMWHSCLQCLLPPAALLLLEKQRSKIFLDWSAVSAAFPTLSYDLYVYNWFLVSTRTFYYTSPKLNARKPLNREDCLALSPFADLFNHADLGCEVTFSSSGYIVSANRDIEKGEEVYISYGKHTNDFLLAEYGFILAGNRWDNVCLDSIILPFFSEEQKQNLKEAGFLGKFVLDKEGVCYRTQVALRLLCMPANNWQVLVANGLEDNDEYQVTVDGILLAALKLHLEGVDEQLQQIEVLDLGVDIQKETLNRRWEEIRLLLTLFIDSIKI